MCTGQDRNLKIVDIQTEKSWNKTSKKNRIKNQNTYVIIVLNSVVLLVLQYFWGGSKVTPLSVGIAGPVSVGIPRPVKVGVAGLVSVRHSWTSLEWSKFIFLCNYFFLK